MASSTQDPAPKSYTSTRIGIRARANELLNLYRSQVHTIPERAAEIVREMGVVDERVERLTGIPMRGLKALDIGPGQQLGHMTYLATYNDAIGIDLDVNPQGWAPGPYLRLLRTNGALRFLKTVVRKALGVDARLRREIARALGRADVPRPKLLQMDATAMDFADDGFDLVFSRAVFEHIGDPRMAFREVARVLRPGGVAHINVHLYTSDSGCHDVRILGAMRGDLPYWPHLRESSKGAVIENSFLNRVALADWVSMVAEELPGAEIETEEDSNPNLRDELARARAAGDLALYEDQELLTVALNAVWTKPGG
ncbi:MAG: SAM-dependent methyltransferase [Chlamydiales bacterium]|jgi:SAM-dependent methyltransferase